MSFVKSNLSRCWPLFIVCLIIVLSCDTDPDPTCTDGIQNGGETGIDCGGPCDACIEKFYDVVFDEYEAMGEIIQDYIVNIKYDRNTLISGNEIDLTVNFFEPESDDATERPLIIMIGGYMGAFSPWNFQFIQNYDYASYFASRGYLLALPNIRYWDLGNGDTQDYIPGDEMLDTFAKARADLLSLIRFFRKNASTYGIDTDNIWLMGFSGGGGLALMAAYLDENDLDEHTPEFKTAYENNGGIEGDGNNKGYSSAVKGVISLAGFMPSASFVDPGEPPSLNMRGMNDFAHPYDCEEGDPPWSDPGVACGAHAIASMSEDNVFYEITGDPADPMAPLDPSQCPECADKILDFIYTRLGY